MKSLRRRQYYQRHARPSKLATGDDGAAGIARIAELSRTARATWFALLGYLAFVGVTLLGVKDADFFLASRETQLPLIGVTIPTDSFFWTAPIFGAALYIYLQLYLQKLWEALAKPGPTHRGEPLGAHIFPWLISDWALKRRGDGAHVERPMGWLASLVTVLLVFWAGPIVLLSFWWRSMPAHDEWLTLTIGAAALASLYAGCTGWWDAMLKLKAQGEVSEDALSTWSARWKRPLALSLFVAIALLSWMRTEGGLDFYVNMAIDLAEELRGPDDYTVFRADTQEFLFYQLENNPKELTLQEQQEIWVRDHPWIPNLADVAFTPRPGPLDDWLNLAPADFRSVSLTPRPSDWIGRDTAEKRFRAEWCKRRGLDPKICRPPQEPFEQTARRVWCKQNDFPVDPTNGDEHKTCAAYFADLDRSFSTEWLEQRGEYLNTLDAPDMRDRDFRNADFGSAFLPGANLSRARLEGADLVEARLEGADLYRARLEGAFLSLARLEGADLGEARLAGAFLSRARLEGADLYRARLEGAKLDFARLEGAYLVEARLEGAKLVEARLEGAYLNRARLEGADLYRARLEGANLGEALLRRAKLVEARLEGANLGFAQLERANLNMARLEEAKLDFARLEGAYLGEARLEGTDLYRARLERANLGEARLEGANLDHTWLERAYLGFARLEGAYLNRTHFESTDLRAADISGAALRSVDYTNTLNATSEQINTAFGDGSVTLPAGWDWPTHWPREALSDDAFYGRWRHWRESEGLPWPPPGSALEGLASFEAIPPD